MIFELIGLPRSGKSTVVKEAQLEKIIIHEEFFDEVPYYRTEHDKYNLWYAKEVAKRIKLAIEEKGDHLFQRGASDRIAFAEALFKVDLLSRKTLDEHKYILSPLIQQTDKIIWCYCSVNESMKRDTPSDSITGDKKFLETLANEYERLSERYNLIKINTEQHLSESVKELLNALK